VRLFSVSRTAPSHQGNYRPRRVITRSALIMHSALIMQTVSIMVHRTRFPLERPLRTCAVGGRRGRDTPAGVPYSPTNSRYDSS
jgi:hypothetical protein